jgi:CRISPR/Cas system CSM-associated protein Csm3 (group 7 of RAMP superfamily)
LNYDIALSILFTTEKKVNIGSGGLALKTKSEVPFARVRIGSGEEKLFIPASTIKGLLRTSLIRVSNLLGYSSNVADSVNPESLRSLKDDVVTNIFGKPGRCSKIKVSPAVLDNLDTYPLPHVKIDDKTRVAEEQGLFTVEYLPIGCNFKVKLVGNNLEIEEIRALMVAIAEIKYERVGKAGIVDVKIVVGESKIPKEVAGDPIVSLVLGVIGI